MPDKQSLIDSFDAFNRKKVLIIGDVMLDAYLWGSVERISPEAPVPIVSVNKRENRLGGAANVALNIKSMGAEPILCSVIGNDQKGEELIALLKAENMPCSGIIQSEERITTTKFRVIGNKAQLLRVDEEITADLNDKDEEKLFNQVNKIISEQKVEAIIFQDYNKGILTESLIEKATTLAGKHGIPTIVDPKKRNFGSFKNVTLFKPNLKEIREGLNRNIDLNDINELSEAVRVLHEIQNIDIVLTTLAESGVFVSYRSEKGIYFTHHIQAHLRSISDVSGAGDTVVSVATLCYVLGYTPEDLAATANLAGGIVCETSGVVPIDKNRLLQETIKLFE